MIFLQKVYYKCKNSFIYLIRNMVVPKNRWGDYLIALIDFLLCHRRFPKNKMLFNDVLFKIKTNGELIDPLRIFITDKEYLNFFVIGVLGQEYNVPTLALIRIKQQVDTFRFPSDCVIKPTHCSGKMILRRNNAPVDKKLIQSWFDLNHYHLAREVNYNFLKPKVIIEPIIFNNPNLFDYKFFCYHGKVKLFQVDIDRHSNHQRIIFDADCKICPFSLGFPRSKSVFRLPKNIKGMIKMAEKVAAYFSFIRIDLYTDGNQIFVGEITNVHGSGLERFQPPESELLASKIIFS